jgi:hypothetical protein
LLSALVSRSHRGFRLVDAIGVAELRHAVGDLEHLRAFSVLAEVPGEYVSGHRTERALHPRNRRERVVERRITEASAE